MSGLPDRIAGLSPEKRALLLKRLAKTTAAEPPPIPHLPREPGARYSLSVAQQRLWLLDRLVPGTAAYNITSATWVEGALDAGRLRRALSACVARHEALRTTFGAADGEPYQRIDEPEPARLPVVDLSGLAAEPRQSVALALAGRAAGESFDLGRGPLFRAHLLRLAPELSLLALNMHHAVTDGWSIDVIYRDLAAAYEALSRGEGGALPEPAIQYLDYAAFQGRALSGELGGETLARQREFWRENLAAPLPVLELPTDHPRPALPSYRGDSVALCLPPQIATALRGFAARSGATPFMVLLAAYGALLSRYSGQRDLLVGMPVANRARREVAEVVGYFVNTVVVRLDLSGRPSLSKLTERAREASLAAAANQELPFESLLDELAPARDPSRSPLFQTLLSYQNYQQDAPAPAGLRYRFLTADQVNTGAAKFDLTLFLAETAGEIEGFFEFPTDLFEAATVRRLAGHLENLLAAALAAPETPFDDLELMAPAERRQVLETWNATAAPLPEPGTMHGLVAAQACRSPNAVAVEHEGATLTYRELDLASDRLAARLAAAGAGPEAIVGIYLERSLEMVIALLGVLKTGAAYLPLDPAFPADRLAFMMADAGVRLAVTAPPLAAGLPDAVAPAVLEQGLDSGPDWGAAAEPGPAVESRAATPAVSPEQRAYVIYTSGSTGRPKGVEIPHRAAVNFLASMRRAPGLAAEDRLLAVTTLSFDIAVLELFLPLAVGARVILAGRDTATEGPRLARLLAASGATVMQATPATWRLLLATGWQGSPSLTALSGGEALPRPLADELSPRVAALWNLYGPTETTVWSTAERLAAGAPITVGRPIANTRVYVRDARGHANPVGIPGELAIGGAGVARGYLARPALTAERFVPDPFAPAAENGARLYRTGDLARWRPDGRLEVLGRTDHQVKLRGHRIELGEIETVLARQAGVRLAVVVLREDRPGDARLVAYLEPHSRPGLDGGHEVLPAALREAARQSLPEYMVPSLFVVLEKLPLTPNGKVDRKALPVPEGDSAVERVPPSTPEQEALAGMWREVLGLAEVGVEESFFDLGGHSLTGAQLLAKIQRQFGVELPLKTLFEAPTIAALAEVIVARQLETLGSEESLALLADLESMSEEEIQALLAEESA